MASIAVVNWSSLKSVRAWHPLGDVAASAEQIKNGVYRVSDHAYLVASAHDQELRDGRPGSPFVTSVVWAVSDGAARRCVLMEIEADDPSVVVETPPEMLLPGADSTYAGLIAVLKTGSHGHYSERGQYRVVPDGMFVQRVVEVGSWTFCFRSLSARKKERPYAVKWLLSR